ncbi:MAG: carboxypeptidase-like regulatory domain-containing protein [Mucilaginibacter sp.]
MSRWFNSINLFQILKNFVLAISAMLLPFLAAAQFSVSGKIIDQKTGTTLPGANVILAPTLSTISDADGAYKLDNIAEGKYVLKVTYVGYQPFEKTIVLASNLVVNVSLSGSTALTEEVTVSATRASNNSPTAFTNLNKNDLDKNNSGRGFEYLLEQTPSTVVT